jgi:hypothetical protein
MESVAIRRELQARPARWCASWGRPKLTDRAAEWGSVSSCSRSAALAIKTLCTHRCWRGQEKYIRQRVCAATFGRNSCPTKSRRSIPPRADGRSQQESMVDPTKSRWSIPARADGRTHQLVSKQGSSGSRCRCRRCDGVRWQQWRRGRRAMCRPVRDRWWEPALRQRIMCWSCRACCARRRMSPEREGVRRPAVCRPVLFRPCACVA